MTTKMTTKIVKNKKKSRGGYAIIETIFYISIFVVLSIAIINSMIYMAKYFKETKVQRELSEGASVIERLSREIRNAYDITSITPTSLKLTTEGEEGTPTKTIDFILSGGEVQMLDDNALVGNINSANITVTALSFTQINTTEGKAVRVTLTVQSESDLLGRTADFFNTVALRGLYQAHIKDENKIQKSKKE